MNSLPQPLNQKLINSPIINFSLQRGTFVYRVEKSNEEIESFEFLNFFYLLSQ